MRSSQPTQRGAAIFAALMAACASTSRESAPPESAEPSPATSPARATIPTATPVNAPPSDASVASEIDAGARASESGPSSVGSGAVPHTPPTVKLRGACVKPVEHAAKSFGKKMPLEFFRVVEAELDFDGDGQNDFLVDAGAVNITSTTYLYVRRGDCGHHVGTIVTEAAGFRLADRKTFGLFDLEGETACRVECCPRFDRYAWRFDGQTYRLREKKPETRTCSRPSDNFR